jgi:hypothetical protein
MAWRDSAGRLIRANCTGGGGVRHWFTLHGHVGVRAPVCQRCGAPNPRPLTDAELAEYRACGGRRGLPADRAKDGER